MTQGGMSLVTTELGVILQRKNYQDAYESHKNSIIHLKNPCIHQEIYGGAYFR